MPSSDWKAFIHWDHNRPCHRHISMQIDTWTSLRSATQFYTGLRLMINPSQKSIQEYSKSLIRSHGLGFHWISLDPTGFYRISLVLYDVFRLGNSLVRYFWKTLENAGKNETFAIMLDIIRSIFHWGLMIAIWFMQRCNRRSDCHSFSIQFISLDQKPIFTTIFPIQHTLYLSFCIPNSSAGLRVLMPVYLKYQGPL